MDFKLLGSVLLIVGTSIGAGMLALPIATAQLGFYGSLVLLFTCWFIMTAGAFLLLEVNLWMPTNSNINTMARHTIGPIGQIISWLSFLLLLYSLLAAYIGGGSDLFHDLLDRAGVDIPLWLAAVLFTSVFGSVVFMGMHTIDYVNRGLMLVKFSAYFLLIFLLFPVVSQTNLVAGEIKNVTSTTAMMVTITSFGYAAIVPSLRIYLHGDVKKLKKAILIGSLIPLVCYIAWDFAIMGVLPLQGENGLQAILSSDRSTSDLVSALTTAAANSWITLFARLFTSVCVLTSFLGVSLCLFDFWADALQVEKKGFSNLLITFMVFLPPLIVVLFEPGIFVKALEYAGIYCLVLLVLLPAWMTWKGRHKHHLLSQFKVRGGLGLFITLILFSLIMTGRVLLNG